MTISCLQNSGSSQLFIDDIRWKILRGLFEFEIIKPATLRTSHGNVNTLAQLKQVLSLGIILKKCKSQNV